MGLDFFGGILILLLGQGCVGTIVEADAYEFLFDETGKNARIQLNLDYDCRIVLSFYDSRLSDLNIAGKVNWERVLRDMNWSTLSDFEFHAFWTSPLSSTLIRPW